MTEGSTRGARGACSSERPVRFALSREGKFINIWHPSEFVKTEVLLLHSEELFSSKERVPTPLTG